MTKIERKRAKSLEKTARLCGTMGNVNIMLAILTAAAFIIDICMFPVALEEGQPEPILMVHIMLMTMFSEMIVSFSMIQIGDTAFVQDSGTLMSMGTAFVGKFLCTLPFEAKDLQNLRLIHRENQIAAAVLSTAVMQAAFIISESLGHAVCTELIGAGALFIIIEAIMMMLDLFVRKNPFVSIILIFIFPMALIILLSYGFEKGTLTYETLEKFSFLNEFSGVSGIIIMIISGAAVIFFGELFSKCKPNVSWNLR